MPFLSLRRPSPEIGSGAAAASLTQTTTTASATAISAAVSGRCTYAGCESGWMQRRRNRAAPVFEEGWTCSAACSVGCLQAAIRRELMGRQSPCATHRHRIPLGLLMMEQGWITQTQLRQALAAQRASGGGRLGEWLVRQRAVHESQVTRALAMQWSCPVLPAATHDAAAVTAVMPRLFVDAFGALPLRLAGDNLFYLGFEQRPDPVLSLALTRMLEIRVEYGIVPESEFRPALREMVRAEFPPVELVEAVNGSAAARAMANALEKAHPAASRLVRVHNLLWVRFWRRCAHASLSRQDDVSDLICSIGSPW